MIFESLFWHTGHLLFSMSKAIARFGLLNPYIIPRISKKKLAKSKVNEMKKTDLSGQPSFYLIYKSSILPLSLRCCTWHKEKAPTKQGSKSHFPQNHLQISARTLSQMISVLRRSHSDNLKHSILLPTGFSWKLAKTAIGVARIFMRVVLRTHL